MFFSYLIVPKGDQAGQALTGGHLSIGNLEKAKRHVQTVPAPNVAQHGELEVILLDHAGLEIWRGPYLGPW
jgi:hypothetical protein